ncbi:MAG: gdhB 2 [Verrucomicrobiales bacterium]|nr:gdhB 2 [Verrucomicrobiales bacterium]
MRLYAKALLLSVCCFSAVTLFAEAPLPQLRLKQTYEKVAMQRPMWLCEAPDGSKRIFVVEQRGRILIMPKDRSASEAKTFLDISDRKPFDKNEEGLLGFAFHPKYKRNGKFYIFYSQQDPKRTVISEFKVSKDADVADKSSERILMQWERPNWNHDGGQVSFGPDGYLYIGVGDGGGKNDQYGNSQKTDSYMAKMLRIDVDSRTGSLPYGIPKDNPFVKDKKFLPEIYAWGLRNPWRFCFDRKTGLLYCGDVGQDKWEEIDIIEKGGNYGWSYREGFHEYKEGAPANAKFLEPILEYPHTVALGTNHLPGLSITAGYVYRGKKIPSLRGVYVYGDWANGILWGLRYEQGKVTQDGVLEMAPKVFPPRQISSFGEDEEGEIYLLGYDSKIYAVEEAPTTRTAEVK